ncbi:hypothetical protein N0V88_006715 [Collariella sp. IMI 366227]|nr:hypothetical protein N0V88_006715 [Collariella sp. IMI 366227]
MPKRKSVPEEQPAEEPAPRRSVRLQKSDEPKTSPAADGDRVKARKVTAKPSAKRNRSSKAPAAAKEVTATSTTVEHPQGTTHSTSSVPGGASTTPPTGGKNYWLLKAEPETRFENGTDVKFSIDDLAARTEPEPWDGIRAYAARNNLRAMKQGDLAFFYHSNCKEPGIVGTMEIVQEHSPDLSAHDPKAPYYDPKSKPADPKWSVVHVKFRSKFAVPIGLKELREMGGAGKPLQNMQMLKQSRLSVSRVSEGEWEYLVGVAEDRARE